MQEHIFYITGHDGFDARIDLAVKRFKGVVSRSGAALAQIFRSDKPVDVIADVHRNPSGIILGIKGCPLVLLGNAPRCDCRNILRSAHDGKHIREITADADARLTDVIFSTEIVVVKDAAHGLVVAGETVVSKRIQTILVQGCRLMFRAPGGIRQLRRFFDPVVYIRIFSCLLRINRIIQILGCKELIRGSDFCLPYIPQASVCFSPP